MSNHAQKANIIVLTESTCVALLKLWIKHLKKFCCWQRTNDMD